jgi:hypothetical protein
VAQIVARRLKGRPEFKSRLGTPDKALCLAEAMRITRVYLTLRVVNINILNICSITVTIKKKRGSMPPNPLTNKKLKFSFFHPLEKLSSI